MSVDKIRADFVVVGEPNQHYLEKANQLLVDFLKKEPYGFSGCWNDTSCTTYTLNWIHLPGHVVDPNIIMYHYPINFEDWQRVMKADNIPEHFKLNNGPKLVCSFEYSLRNMGSKNLAEWFNGIEDQVQRFYGQLKFNEDEITPKREINLLWDNGHMLFLPESFKEYIKKNEESGVVGYLGHLTDSL